MKNKIIEKISQIFLLLSSILFSQVTKKTKNILNSKYNASKSIIKTKGVLKTPANKTSKNLELYYDRVPHHIEISPLICRANHWTGFYEIRSSVMKELTVVVKLCLRVSGYASEYFPEIFRAFFKTL